MKVTQEMLADVRFPRAAQNENECHGLPNSVVHHYQSSVTLYVLPKAYLFPTLLSLWCRRQYGTDVCRRTEYVILASPKR
jgi:hypothetical protein